uniref:Centrosomal protein 43 n=1 Tax=Graphocephala atropunctata TaxID=36148 RepID=A0A1B6LJQ6_9HEMI
MSVNGDTELRDLVSQTLENAGVLSKIRAELRANVFLVLEEHEAFKGRNLPFSNSHLKNFLSTQEGIVTVSLVREFLEFFGLEFTASVFEPETQTDTDYAYVGRNKLAHNLKLDSGKRTPLIAQVLRESKLCVTATVPISKEEPADNALRKEKIRDEKKSQETNNINHITKTEVLNGPSKSAEKEGIITETKLPPPPPPSFQNHIKKPDSLKLDLNQINVKSPGASLSSLGSLPPLGLNQIPRSSSGKNSKQVSSDIKALLDLGSESPEHNYEEDFHPSGSEKMSKGTNRSLSGSGSEIDEEMSVGMDDQDQEQTTDQSGSGNEKTPRDL